MNSDQHSPLIALVVPCYNESAVLPISAPVLLDVLERLYAAGKFRTTASSYFATTAAPAIPGSEITKLHAADKRYGLYRLLITEVSGCDFRRSR